MNELVCIFKNGSWYQVYWLDKTTNFTKKVQGYKNLIKFIKYACIKHTTGKPLVNDIKVNGVVSMITVDGSLTDKEQWNIINQRLDNYLNKASFVY